jgi:hypothetical protein
MFVSCEDAMTYAIHASKNGQSVVTIRISPIAAVDKVRLLERAKLTGSKLGLAILSAIVFTNATRTTKPKQRRLTRWIINFRTTCGVEDAS